MGVGYIGGAGPGELRWMGFIDGENLTIRAQELARKLNLDLENRTSYEPDVFVWMPNKAATAYFAGGRVPVQANAIRVYYYTSQKGDEDAIRDTRNRLRALGFDPWVFKKSRKELRAKGVDIALAKDMLSHAFQSNYDCAVLLAGDGDYVPLVEEVKRLGKRVHVAFFRDEGLSDDLRIVADNFVDITPYFERSFPKR